MQKINITSQISLDILQNKWVLLFACPCLPDHTHMNGLNHIDILMYAYAYTKNLIYST